MRRGYGNHHQVKGPEKSRSEGMGIADREAPPTVLARRKRKEREEQSRKKPRKVHRKVGTEKLFYEIVAFPNREFEGQKL